MLAVLHGVYKKATTHFIAIAHSIPVSQQCYLHFVPRVLHFSAIHSTDFQRFSAKAVTTNTVYTRKTYCTVTANWNSMIPQIPVATKPAKVAIAERQTGYKFIIYLNIPTIPLLLQTGIGNRYTVTSRIKKPILIPKKKSCGNVYQLNLNCQFSFKP